MIPVLEQFVKSLAVARIIKSSVFGKLRYRQAKTSTG
jgi:hypothetical protein